jgi:hypothetical protein
LFFVGNRKPERGGARRGRGNFQQKIICDRFPVSPPNTENLPQGRFSVFGGRRSHISLTSEMASQGRENFGATATKLFLTTQAVYAKHPSKQPVFGYAENPQTSFDSPA